LTGWDVVRGFCRDAGEFILFRFTLVFSESYPPDVALVLWNMLRGSKLNRLSIRLATRISWADLFMFEKYATFVSPTASLSKLTHPNRIAKPSHDSQDLQREAAADTTELVVGLAVDSVVVQWVAPVADRSMSPTFVSNPLFVFVNLC
jgi:hypothetical protein